MCRGTGADGFSEHDWLEDVAKEVVELLALIDDATSRITAILRGRDHENHGPDARYLRQQGRPVELYTDRHGIFRAEDQHGEATPMQLTGSGELGIQLISGQ